MFSFYKVVELLENVAKESYFLSQTLFRKELKEVALDDILPKRSIFNILQSSKEISMLQ